MEPDRPARRVRRLTLAVDDEELRRELAELLAREQVEVEFVSRLADLEEVEADAIVTEAETAQGAEELLARTQEPDTPGVLVLSEQDDPAEHAGLVARGASAVLDADSPDLRERIVELVEAEAEGGLHGPESGGFEAEPKLVDFQSKSPRMTEFLDLVRRVAASDSTLLITGETGVGKERLARAIHAESRRSAGPFVVVNCGALPENLLESELFGHERGAFTGAAGARSGRFEEADGGTILLDEIGEMPTHLQVNLLTVLQRRTVRRLGASKPRTVDVRILAATNRDLRDDIAAGRFRQDLYFRLNVVALEIPPLRERREDLPLLVGRFIRHFAEVHARPEVVDVDEDAMAALLAYAWPGNVREVVNVVERAVLLCRGERIGIGELPEHVRHPKERAHAGPSEAVEAGSELFELPLQEARRRLVADFERRYLDSVLRRCGGAVGKASREAGINPRTLYEKLRRHGLRKETYRRRD